jgi:hypothetical protein
LVDLVVIDRGDQTDTEYVTVDYAHLPVSYPKLASRREIQATQQGLPLTSEPFLVYDLGQRVSMGGLVMPSWPTMLSAAEIAGGLPGLRLDHPTEQSESRPLWTGTNMIIRKLCNHERS